MTIDLLLAGLTIGTIGKVLLGITVILVHGRITREHKIDRAVLKEMRKEKWYGVAGIILMVLGYILEMLFYVGEPFV